MITVEEAEKIIQSRVKDFGIEKISFENCLGRVLAKNIIADRDLPPFNRVTMDGIAINFSLFEKGNRQFKIVGTQAAGDKPIEINEPGECIEVMTGGALPKSACDSMDSRWQSNLLLPGSSCFSRSRYSADWTTGS